MTQSATKPSTSIQAAGAGSPTPEATAPAQAASLSFGWRVALTLWVAVFAALLAFELLNTLVRSIGRLF